MSDIQQIDQSIQTVVQSIALKFIEQGQSIDEAQQSIANVGALIGDLATLETSNKGSIVDAINGLRTNMTTAIATSVQDLIGGADDANDTLGEIANRVTALAQADNGFVSFVSTQSLSDAEQSTVLTNIGAARQVALDASVTSITFLTGRVDAIEAVLSNPSDYAGTFNAALNG